MLTLGRRRFLSGLALGSLLLGGATCATADEVVDSTIRPEAKAAPTTAQAVEPAEGGGVAQEAIKHMANDSHRRRTAESHASPKSSRRCYAPSTVTELPIERLRLRNAMGDVEVHVPAEPRGDALRKRSVTTDRTTLAEVMKRLAGWTDSCPLCGKSCPLCGTSQADQDQGLPDLVVPSKPSADQLVLGQIGRDEGGDETLCRPLRAGEPAQIILDTQSRLGKSVLDGTEFSGSPELLIQWIRALDEENRRQQAMLEEVSRADVDEVEEDVSAVSGQSQIEALRHACRQLQEAAELLEERNLFESADSLRKIAAELREQSRERVGDLEARRMRRGSAACVKGCGTEDCEGEHE